MGFIDDVDWIMERTPTGRQVALFSATVPEPIKGIAQRHLVDPVEIEIKAKTTTAETIRQRYWMVSGTSWAKLNITKLSEDSDIESPIWVLLAPEQVCYRIRNILMRYLNFPVVATGLSEKSPSASTMGDQA